MIHVKRTIQEDDGCEIPFDMHLVITIDGGSCKDFTTAMNRALNCWPDAPPELKELADMLNHGKILQDYYSQDTSKKGG